MSYEARAGAVLYAKDIDRVASFYVAVLGLEVADRSDEYRLLESQAFQLVVLRTPQQIASTIQIEVPPTRRADAAVKLVFFVPSIAAVRTLAEAHGGTLRGLKQEWTFNGYKVCDGLDPEGNVIQFRTLAV